MTKKEKMAMIKKAIITISQDNTLDLSAKQRGIRSLKAAYRKYAVDSK